MVRVLISFYNYVFFFLFFVRCSFRCFQLAYKFSFSFDNISSSLAHNVITLFAYAKIIMFFFNNIVAPFTILCTKPMSKKHHFWRISVRFQAYRYLKLLLATIPDLSLGFNTSTYTLIIFRFLKIFFIEVYKCKIIFNQICCIY